MLGRQKLNDNAHFKFKKFVRETDKADNARKKNNTSCESRNKIRDREIRRARASRKQEKYRVGS